MFVSRFQIDFENRVSRTGYAWNGDKIIQKRPSEYTNEYYQNLTYSDFAKLSDFDRDTEKLKKEAIKFFDRWGLLGRHEGADYLGLINAINLYKTISLKIKKTKQNFRPSLHDLPILETRLQISYDWDRNSLELLPTLRPKSLIDAITVTLALVGPQPVEKTRKCLFLRK